MLDLLEEIVQGIMEEVVDTMEEEKVEQDSKKGILGPLMVAVVVVEPHILQLLITEVF